MIVAEFESQSIINQNPNHFQIKLNRNLIWINKSKPIFIEIIKIRVGKTMKYDN